MTASQPNLKVLAVGRSAVWRWFGPEDGSEHGDSLLVLCETQRDTAASLKSQDERDLCDPGAWSGTVFALAEAGIGKAGAAGVAELHRREVRALERANGFARALLDIGQVLRDLERDSQSPGQSVGAFTLSVATALAAITGTVNAVGPDIANVEPSKSPREVLAAHGSSRAVSLRNTGTEGTATG